MAEALTKKDWDRDDDETREIRRLAEESARQTIEKVKERHAETTQVSGTSPGRSAKGRRAASEKSATA